MNQNETLVKVLYGSREPDIQALRDKYVQEAHGVTEERLRAIWTSYSQQLRALLRKRGIVFGDEVECEACG